MDNAGLLTRLNACRDNTDSYPNSTLAPNWNVVEQIHQTHLLIQANHQYAHAKGHQDDQTAYDNLSLNAQANIDADIKAGEYNYYHPLDRPLGPLLPAACARLTINSRTITGHYTSRICHAATYQQLHQKIIADNQWPAAVLPTIAWPIFHTICQQHTHHCQWTTKFAHNLLPTNALRHRYNGKTPSECYLCHAPNETFEHCLQCPHQNRQNWQKTFLSDLRTFCYAKKTRESLTTVIVPILSHYFLGTTMDPLKYPPTIQPPITDQNAIGWDAFLKGFLSTKWSPLQYKYLKQRNLRSNINTGSTWSTPVIHRVWILLCDLWETHNKEIHGEDSTQEEACTHDRLIYKI